MKKYIPIILHSIALIALATLIANHFEYRGITTILMMIAAIGIGHLIGSWTCHLHNKGRGFWITIAIFVMLNLIHSVIDGASIGTISSFSQGLAILSHELARQPAFYIVLWCMLTPFTQRHHRFIIIPLAVTGVWFIGSYLGYELFVHINTIPWLEPIADQAVFLFLGDIIHHIREEYRKLNTQGHQCCHT